MTISRLQGTSTGSTSATPSLQYTSALTNPSHLLVHVMAWDNAEDGIATPSSNQGHTFTALLPELVNTVAVVPSPVANPRARTWIAPNTGTTQPTISFSGANFWFVVIEEWAGLDGAESVAEVTRDVQLTGSGSDSVACSSAITPAENGAVVLTVITSNYESVDDPTSLTVPTGYTSSGTRLSYQADMWGGVAHKIQTTAGAETPSWTVGKSGSQISDYIIYYLALKAAVAGGDATATPAAMSVVATPQAPTLSAGQEAAPAVISVTATPQVAAAEGDASPAPAVIDVTATPQVAVWDAYFIHTTVRFV